MNVTQDILDQLHQKAADAHPHECCGILIGEQSGHAITITHITPAANVHPTPKTHFEIDPQALFDAHRAARAASDKQTAQIVGYYHSHPTGPARPSATDAAMASGDGRIWAIIGQPSDVTFWRNGENGFEELSYHLTSE